MYTVYKVVREFGGLYFSATAPGKYKTIYELGVTSKCHPDTKGLFVFENLKQAKIWSHISAAGQIVLKCSCRAKPKEQAMRAGQYFQEWALDDFWNREHSDMDCSTPGGTCLVPTLKPIKVMSERSE